MVFHFPSIGNARNKFLCGRPFCRWMVWVWLFVLFHIRTRFHSVCVKAPNEHLMVIEFDFIWCLSTRTCSMFGSNYAHNVSGTRFTIDKSKGFKFSICMWKYNCIVALHLATPSDGPHLSHSDFEFFPDSFPQYISRFIGNRYHSHTPTQRPIHDSSGWESHKIRTRNEMTKRYRKTGARANGQRWTCER